MKFAEFTSVIDTSLQSSFVWEDNTAISLAVRNAAPTPIANVQVRRVQRADFPKEMKCFWKTFLIVELKDKSELRLAFEWAAAVRDILSNPETSDLYLFVCWNKEVPSSEECLRIEATEEFCRKYVVRPGETGKQFIERTLIEDIASVLPKPIGSDPLLVAFQEVETKRAWFNKDEQELWREAFASGKSGRDLIDALFFKRKDKK